MTAAIGTSAMENTEEIGAASVDYTLFSGYVALAYMWARMALISQRQIRSGAQSGSGFYQSKLATARFYFARILPRTSAHAKAAMAGAETVMAIEEDAFSF